MKTLLTLFCNLTNNAIKAVIDPTSFYFSGSTEDYDYDAPQSFNSISFVLADPTTTEQFVAELVGRMKEYRPSMEEDKLKSYVRMRTEFESYDKDQRPRVIIRFKSGSKGWASPPSFEFSAVVGEAVTF